VQRAAGSERFGPTIGLPLDFQFRFKGRSNNFPHWSGNPLNFICYLNRLSFTPELETDHPPNSEFRKFPQIIYSKIAGCYLRISCTANTAKSKAVQTIESR
jgi:hypothetical protein